MANYRGPKERNESISISVFQNWVNNYLTENKFLTTKDMPVNVSTFTNDSGYITYAPTKVSELTNDRGYITSAPVTSVNGQTGSVVLTLFNGDYNNLTNKPTIPVLPKVKYYSVVSTASGVWTLSLGTDFNTVLDVQAVSVNVNQVLTGVRMCSLDAYTSTSKTITGVALASVAGLLSLVATTTVRVRVEGT